MIQMSNWEYSTNEWQKLNLWNSPDSCCSNSLILCFSAVIELSSASDCWNYIAVCIQGEGHIIADKQLLPSRYINTMNFHTWMTNNTCYAHTCQPGNKHVEMDICSQKSMIKEQKAQMSQWAKQVLFPLHSLLGFFDRLGTVKSLMVVYELSLATVSKLTHWNS